MSDVNMNQNRRNFVKATATAVSSLLTVPYFLTAQRANAESKSDRHLIAAIGTGHRAGCINERAQQFADIVAVCDVDRERADNFAVTWCQPGKVDVYGDYRQVLDRPDVEAVIIAVGDRWHTKIAADAMRAGKDVYVEKPISLTINEGKFLRKVVAETNRVCQVGTQQRSEFNDVFLYAVALARSGRLGKKLTATCRLNPNPTGGPFVTTDPPRQLDWEMWSGPVPVFPYCPERGHGMWNFWYEYGGGHVIALGTHHLDIAQWALGCENTGPVEIEGTGTLQNIDGGYNTHVTFEGRLKFANGNEIHVESRDKAFEIIIEGENGRIRVNRGNVVSRWRDGGVEDGKLVGAPIEELRDTDWDWLRAEAAKLYRNMPKLGKPGGTHMGNFFHCLRNRLTPISDVDSQHRSTTSCHLLNLALRLNRTLRWNPELEDFIDDSEASAMLSRPRRKGFELS